ncbi:MAG: DUF4339 domain-containing protein [Prevotella sp.]|nr:DUF4339 domain-containing protein [Candidatus Prevotella equi]
MGILNALGLSTKKEADKREREARSAGRSAGFSSGHAAGKEAIVREQQTSLSNLAKGSQFQFSVPWFDVFDPRFENFAVPVTVRGMIVYGVDDISKFNSINKTQKVNDDVLQQKMRGQLCKFIKTVITNAPSDNNIQVLQMERKITEIGEHIQRLVTPQIEKFFAINIRSLDIMQIMIDKESRGYRELKSVTTDLEGEGLKRRHEMMFSGQEEMQRIQLENQRETMRIQREEMQRATRLQTETNFLGTHQANLNAQVGIAQGMFAQQQTASSQSGLLGGSMQTMSSSSAPPMPRMDGMPPMPVSMPQVQYMVGVSGQQVGPCNWSQLQLMVQQGQLTRQTYVWKQGMPQWQFAGEIQELQFLFGNVLPQMPGM